MFRLIVGLGNPGKKYADTRHNAGFWLLDAFAAERSLTFTQKRTFGAEICHLDDADCRLCKPTGLMNLSGRTVQSIAGYYKIPPPAILVVHDELDLAPGVVRLKRGGGHGGHNGLRDIILALGGDSSFVRLRIGIGHPGVQHEVTPYVLSRPPEDERRLIKRAIGDALAIMPLLFTGDLQRVMNELHRQPVAGET